MTDDGQVRTFMSEPGLVEGVWGWLVCDDGSESYQFFPNDDGLGEAEAPVPDRATIESIARSVTITPQVPPIRTSPPPGELHLVNLETWFWVDPADWQPVEDGTSAGSVRVDVTATPVTLIVDPGDGSPEIQCPGGGTPYNDRLPADAQHSDCTHTYTRAGTYTATATVVYDVDWTSSIVPGGDLGDITPTGQPLTLQVAEAQAVVVDGGG